MTLCPLVLFRWPDQDEWTFIFSGDKSFTNPALTLIRLRANVCAANCFFDLRNPDLRKPLVAAMCCGSGPPAAFFFRLLKESILLPQWLSLHGFKSVYRSARRTAPLNPQSFCASLSREVARGQI